MRKGKEVNSSHVASADVVEKKLFYNQRRSDGILTNHNVKLNKNNYNTLDVHVKCLTNVE